MKKIVLIGATSNIGSYFSFWARDYFRGTDFELVTAGRRATDFFYKNGFEYFQVDISRPDLERILPTDDVFAVVLMAAAAPSYMTKYDPMSYLQTNVLGTFNVLEYCRKTRADRVLFMQSGYDTYLTSARGIVLQPSTPKNFSYKGDHAVYVISKNTGEALLEHYHQEYGLKNFVFRLPTIYNYSPYHYYYPNGVKTLRPLYKMIENAMRGERLEIWGDGSYAKDMTYVADFSQLLCKAIEANVDGGFYNAGTGVPVTLEEQVRTIADVFAIDGVRSEIVYCPEKKVGGGCLMDMSKARAELGYDPKYSCRLLFEEYKREMALNRFAELLMR